MKVLLAIDESPCSEAATQAVLHQFRSDQCQVDVLHAVKPPTLIPYAYIAQVSDLGEMEEEEVRRGKELLARTAEVLTRAGFRVQTVLEKGDPRAVIVDEASRRNAELIIMGSHGLKGLDRLLIGSVSEAVLHHAHCSVEIVRIP